MSAPVDVLEVMDTSASVLRSHMRRCNNKANHDQPHIEALVRQDRAAYLLATHAEARAAIAELIEADKEYDAALSEFSHAPRPNLSPDSMDEWAEEWMKVAQRADLHDRLQSAKARRAAALARVGGAS